MNAEQNLDSYVACFAAFEDGLELELARTWRDKPPTGHRPGARPHHCATRSATPLSAGII